MSESDISCNPEARKEPAAELEAFDALYRKFYEGYVRFADSYVLDRAVAEDLVSEAFMSYWDHRAEMAPASNVRAYLFAVVKNKCLNHLRLKEYRGKRLQNIGEVAKWDLQMRISTLQACDPEELFSEELQHLVEEAVRELPERTLQVFLLSRYEHKSNREIAELLGISVKGVEFHISKALGLLRVRLKDYLGVFAVLCLFS